VVAAIAPPGHRVAFGEPLEVGAGHVVEDQVVVQLKQFPQAVLEMGLQRFLVRQQRVEAAVEPVIVDLVRRHAQQVRQGRPLVGVLRDVQFA